MAKDTSAPEPEIFRVDRFGLRADPIAFRPLIKGSLEDARKLLGLNQGAMAATMGLSRRQWCNLENGKTPCDVRTKALIHYLLITHLPEGRKAAFKIISHTVAAVRKRRP